MSGKYPEHDSKQSLEQWLEYHDSPLPPAFVEKVMDKVRRQRRMRRLILGSAAVVGTSFGIAGAVILSDSINRLLLQAMSSSSMLPAVATIAAVLILLTGLLSDELNPG